MEFDLAEQNLSCVYVELTKFFRDFSLILQGFQLVECLLRVVEVRDDPVQEGQYWPALADL